MNDPPSTAPLLLWHAAKRPDHGLKTEPAEGFCATCGAPLEGEGAPVAQISGKGTFSQHADFVQGTHFCPGCAWLYNIGKGKPGNVIAIGDDLHFPMISAESAREANRLSWREVFNEICPMPDSIPVAGILTTDFKPRLFPRMRLGSVGSLTLYVHSPDHDQSGLLTFDRVNVVQAADLISECLALGFTKTRCHFGLLVDFDRVRKLGAERVLELENQLDAHRLEPHWIPALLAAHKPLKETA